MKTDRRLSRHLVAVTRFSSRSPTLGGFVQRRGCEEPGGGFQTVGVEHFEGGVQPDRPGGDTGAAVEAGVAERFTQPHVYDVKSSGGVDPVA